MRNKMLASLMITSIILSAVSAPVLAAGASDYTDVASSAWYYEAVDFVSSAGLMDGTTELAFSPEDEADRGTVVNALYRIEGELDVGESVFSDVPEDLSDAVAWASENGIVTGYTDGTFGATDSITREQLVTILYRYAAYKGLDTSVSTTLESYSDNGDVSAYASSAMRWAVASGIIAGTSSSTLSPKGTTTRAQLATILQRIVQGNLTDEIETEQVEESVQADEDRILTVAGTDYCLGSSIADLGEPDEVLASTYAFDWYVYGTDRYTDFVAVGVANDTIVALLSAGPGFSYRGMSCGSQAIDYPTSSFTASVATDSNDSEIVHSVLLIESGYSLTLNYTEEALAGESKMNFHLVNAFRVYHGLNALEWSDKAATAARLHSQDMADNNYFEHESQDGRTFVQRMAAQGISSYTWAGENISAGAGTGYNAYCNWVNSAGHRANMLNAKAEYLGVGAGYSHDSAYIFYFTQDFYAS